MERLDKAIVSRGLAESRVKAQELIKKELVRVNQKVITKPSEQIKDSDNIEIVSTDIFKYVSRGGFKLEKALAVFGYDVKDKKILDIGSSTGGFTDCCLQNGAREMICIDVGTNVMHHRLRNDPRVKLYENTNFKEVSSDLFNGVDTAVVDVSFISLTKIFEKLFNEKIVLDVICLIKPQFECGKEIANKYSGVILNKNIHLEIINSLLMKFSQMGFVCKGLTYSPIKGGDGNIEYLGYFTNKNKDGIDIDIPKIVSDAFLEI